MTKVTIHDTYLNKTFSFFVNKNYNSVNEAEEELKIYKYLNFTIVKVKPVNRVKQIFISCFCDNTTDIGEVLFCSYKYLII